MDSIVTHGIEQVQIESCRHQSGSDFTVRMTRTRTRGKKRKPSTEERTFRRDHKGRGIFTSWPKRWSDGLRVAVETQLNKALG